MKNYILNSTDGRITAANDETKTYTLDEILAMNENRVLAVLDGKSAIDTLIGRRLLEAQMNSDTLFVIWGTENDFVNVNAIDEKRLLVNYDPKKNRNMHFCFDCDDTLYDTEEPFRRAVEVCLPQFHGDLDDFYRRYRAYGDEVYPKVQSGEISTDDSGSYRVRKAASFYGIDMDEAESRIFQQHYKQYQGEITFDPEIEKWLNETDSDIWILTNGPDRHQRMKLNTLKVDRWFKPHHVFTSGEIGVAKPDPKAFETITKSPDNWVYIGDSYKNDIEGAKACGWTTVHYDRHQNGSGEAADYVARNGEQLIEILKGLERNER